MNWLLWSTLGTAVYVLAKNASAVLVPLPATPPPTITITPGVAPAGPVSIDNPGVIAVNQGGPPAPPVPAVIPTTPKGPVVQVKTVVTSGRQYKVTRAGLGIYKVELANDPTVFQLITQAGPLQEAGDPKKLAQLKADEAQFPGNLFT